MFFHRKTFKILLLVGVLLLSTGFSCKCVSSDVRNKLAPFSLEIWGIWDDSQVFEDLITKYQRSHPHASIKYRKFRYEEYEEALLNAWAEGHGPDIFFLHNTWVPAYLTKIKPLPSHLKIPYIEYKSILPGVIKKKTEKAIKVHDYDTISLSDLKKKYSRTVYSDVVFQGDDKKYHIYALPLYLDTLALFYNIDLLDNANIPFPPADWEEFLEDVRLLTRYDTDKNIVQAGAALGTFDNVEKSIDIISLLMMQNGVSLDNFMEKKYSSRTLEAWRFYLDFTNPNKEIYTWNKDMPNSFDAFTEGRLAFFFGYSYYIPFIKTKAPGLNFGITPMPQVNVTKPINYANYWAMSVYQGSKHPEEAWDFILFLSQPENMKEYLKKTHRPTAIRDLISEQENDPELKPFVSQVLTAQSWHRIKDYATLEKSFQRAFQEIAGKEEKLDEILKNLAAEINLVKLR